MMTEMETVIIFYSCSLVTKFLESCMQMGALSEMYLPGTIVVTQGNDGREEKTSL